MEDKFSAGEMAILRYVISKNYDAYMENTQNIVFTTLAEKGDIDETTATEHIAAFEQWQIGVSYAAGAYRQYQGALWKCLQAHTSQEGWEPDVAVSLWKKAGDPTEEWPEYSQPISALDAYSKGDKVSYNGDHYISDIDNNVWAPDVYGWTKQN